MIVGIADNPNLDSLLCRCVKREDERENKRPLPPNLWVKSIPNRREAA
jgi:hypothetical protein